MEEIANFRCELNFSSRVKSKLQKSSQTKTNNYQQLISM